MVSTVKEKVLELNKDGSDFTYGFMIVLSSYIQNNIKYINLKFCFKTFWVRAASREV